MSTIVSNITGLISAVAAKGRAYTDSRNTLVAHALLSDIPQKTIVEEAGLDKGDVSRIAKTVKSLKPSDVKKVKGLNVSNMDADDVETLQSAVALGSLFRRVKPTPGAAKPSAAKADAVEEETDVAALLTAWLSTATEEQFAARLAIISNVIDTLTAEREAAQAA